jgi:hypothetical protein
VSRLPIVGQDAGTWGSILNDYLLEAHNADGTLKSTALTNAGVEMTSNKGQANGYAPLDSTGKVPTTNLPNEGSYVPLHTAAPTTPDTGDISISGTVQAANVLADTVYQRPFRLLVYYGVPQGVNEVYDNAYASQIFSRWDYVVFGEGLEDPANAYNASSITIMSLATELNPQIQFFGYIDLGVTTENLSISTMQTQVDQWQSMGVSGIFLDTAGYDYDVPRSRLNTMLDYIHGLNMSAIVNAFTPDDVMSSAVNATYNPDGTPTHMGGTDFYMLESWLVNTGSYTPAGYTLTYDLKTRGDSAASYRSTLGVKLLAIGSVDYSSYTAEEITKFFKMQEAAALAYSLDGHGIGAYEYSAVAPNANAVVTFDYYDEYPRFYNTSTTYNINGPWTEISRPDIELIVHIDEPNSIFWYQTPETNALQVLNYSTENDNIGIGTASPQARLHISSNSTTNVTEIIQATTAQTADILELQDINANVLAKVDAKGSPTFSGPVFNLGSNVRGIAAAVTSGQTTLAITFATAQADANYAVLCTPNYATTCYVTNVATTGFTISFGTAAPANATVNWLVVR